jgi:hypothetical protein
MKQKILTTKLKMELPPAGLGGTGHWIETIRIIETDKPDGIKQNTHTYTG